MISMPSAYIKGYTKSVAIDKKRSDNYIRHTTIGDPELDTMMEELSSMPPADLHRFIGAGIEQRDEILRDAPQIMRDFFDNLEEPS